MTKGPYYTKVMNRGQITRFIRLRDKMILGLIREGVVSPLNIGLRLGYQYDNCSSNTCKLLNILIARGLVVKVDKGVYGLPTISSNKQG